jgi:sugar/nucleoside kinase (ribokinase family)
MVLCAIGDLVEDVVVWLAAPPRRGTDTDARVFRHRGGSAANVAAFAAHAGHRSAFVGRVGHDSLGERLVQSLVDGGVVARVQREGRSGTIVVLVEPGGERTMLADRAACTELADVPAAWVTDTSIVHVPAYSLTVEPLATTALWLVDCARRAGALVSIDASSVAVLEAFGVPAVLDLLDRVCPDVVLANAEEAASLGLPGQRPGLTTVVKDGPRAVRVHAPGRPPAEVAVPLLTGVTDTTGAGDAFAAGFLPVFAMGRSLDEAVAAGIALAARVLTSPGASIDEGGS